MHDTPRIGLVGLLLAMGALAAFADRPPIPTPEEFERMQNEMEKNAWPMSPFPDLKPPRWTMDENGRGDYATRSKRFAELCPRFLGETGIFVEPRDDPYRILLKARLKEASIEMKMERNLIEVGKWDSRNFFSYLGIMDDMREIVTDLYAEDSKSLISCLQELVILAKDSQRFTKARVEAGQDAPQNLQRASRFRLKMECALWKAMNPAKR